MNRPAFQVWFKCPKCGGATASNGVHAPRWVVREGKAVLVDCVGDEVKT